MAHKTLIKNARAIVTCNAEDEVIYGADILIEGAKLTKIGKNLELETLAGIDIIDASNKFIYPGLINTHHHFFQTLVRNQVTIDYPNMMVLDWLRKVYPIFQRVNEDTIYYSSITAMGDLLKHGCTCAFDHQYCYTKKSGKLLIDRQMQAAGELGMRFHAGRGTNTLSMDKGSTIPDEMLETTDEFLSDCERIIDAYHDPKEFSMNQIVVAPCQPVNSEIDTFTESVAFARDKGVRLHTHLGEGENDLMVERWGKRTLKWCEAIGFIGPDVWFAHGWELTPEEYKVMARNMTGVSHCPAPAVLGGFDILDMPAMQKEGMLISLGCDGSATNDSSNMLDTLRMAYMMQAYNSKKRGGSPSSYEMLKMATINGAKTLGRSDIGSLEVGKAADLFMIDTSVIELTGTLHDPKNLLARVGITGTVDFTMVNGKVVYKDGSLLGIDEMKMAQEGERIYKNVIEGT